MGPVSEFRFESFTTLAKKFEITPNATCRDGSLQFICSQWHPPAEAEFKTERNCTEAPVAGVMDDAASISSELAPWIVNVCPPVFFTCFRMNVLPVMPMQSGSVAVMLFDVVSNRVSQSAGSSGYVDA